MSILALDPATACGWAADFGGTIRSGCWKLGREHRWLELYRKLETIWEIEPVTVVAIEDVASHGRGEEREVNCLCHQQQHKVKLQSQNVIASHIYGGLVAMIEFWADFRGVRVEKVAVGTLKKFATGSGRATKEDMVAWAKLRWKDQSIKDDNQADALHILDWVCVEVLKRRGKAVVEVGRDD
jgi:Holliday junction resolvasome RuvABC endonuclease subunit